MRGSIFLGAALAAMASAGAVGGLGLHQGRVAAVDESARSVTSGALNVVARYERSATGAHLGHAIFGHGQGRRAAYGWTNRHAQRVARKKRNQARHRAAGRGRK